MFKFTKRAGYGLIALRHLAERHGHGSASAKEIAVSYGMPLPLLSKVLQKLGRNGFLVSEHGTRGDYRLARHPREINVLGVIQAIEGPIILTSCFTEHGECDQLDRCTVREPLGEVSARILELLASISIADMSRQKMNRAPEGRGSKESPDRLSGLGERQPVLSKR